MRYVGCWRDSVVLFSSITTPVSSQSPPMRRLLMFIAAPLQGANRFLWSRLPGVSPGAIFDRPFGTKGESRGWITAKPEVSRSRFDRRLLQFILPSAISPKAPEWRPISDLC